MDSIGGNIDKPTNITITLPTQAYFMSGIRDFTLGLIKNTTSFDEKWAFRFQSIIDELCSNAIEFGSAPGEDIRITFSYQGSKYIQIAVEDSGTGPSKNTAEDMEKLIEERTKPGYIVQGIRGRGLALIIKAWSDELKFEDTEKGGIRVIVKKNISLGNLNESSPENVTVPEDVQVSQTDPTQIKL